MAFFTAHYHYVEFCEDAVLDYPRYALKPLFGLFWVVELHFTVNYETSVVAYYRT